MGSQHEVDSVFVLCRTSSGYLMHLRSDCDIAGVHCMRASRKQIAVYSKAAVARLDEFVGPKA
jgi:hypothetical protein